MHLPSLNLAQSDKGLVHPVAWCSYVKRPHYPILGCDIVRRNYEIIGWGR
jgi:hypothetical protein